jgi:hypothetical protein
LHHPDAGQKPGGKAEALAPQRLADFHPNGAELMTRNTRVNTEDHSQDPDVVKTGATSLPKISVTTILRLISNNLRKHLHTPVQHFRLGGTMRPHLARVCLSPRAL